MLTQLWEGLTPHEVLSWTDGQSAPSKELELLLSSGEVAKDHIQGQPKLALIQTVSTGYEAVDVDAATSLGIWVSDVVKQEPLETTNPLFKLSKVLITPHMAGMTDLMISGTVGFVTQVVANFNVSIRPQSTLNCPVKPRRPSHQRPA